jgi:hypothetical protein
LRKNKKTLETASEGDKLGLATSTEVTDMFQIICSELCSEDSKPKRKVMKGKKKIKVKKNKRSDL